MSSKFPLVSFQELVRFLKEHGFEEISSKGSHFKFKKTGHSTHVVIPFNSGRDLPTGTVKSILLQAGISSEYFKTYFNK